jgi:hypothetical protein
MDAVTILGVASAAIQFVSFASSVVSSAVEIYKSPSGQTHTEYEASTLARDLTHLATQIRDKGELFTEGQDRGGSESERQLQVLCKECLKINAAMESALSTAKEMGIDKFGCSGQSALRSFRKALERVLGYKKTENLIERIDDLREQMMMAILVCLW